MIKITQGRQTIIEFGAGDILIGLGYRKRKDGIDSFISFEQATPGDIGRIVNDDRQYLDIGGVQLYFPTVETIDVLMAQLSLAREILANGPNK